jgi:hypothetical protein
MPRGSAGDQVEPPPSVIPGLEGAPVASREGQRQPDPPTLCVRFAESTASAKPSSVTLRMWTLE